jgi:L,D-transpeptidase catalytic domain
MSKDNPFFGSPPPTFVALFAEKGVICGKIRRLLFFIVSNLWSMNKLFILLWIVFLSNPFAASAQTYPNTPDSWLFTHVVEKNIRVKDYFRYMDKVVRKYDTLLSYKLTPHLLARMNPWIIDSFANTDYYRQLKRGNFIFDQQELVILKKGTTLFVRTDEIANQILEKQAATYIDVNVPEYKLSIIEGADTVGNFLIRVGRNSVRQWAVYKDKVVNLRTKTGMGKIVNTYFKTASLDPATGRVYYKTTRDDNQITMMPLMPWIEPEINKERFGQLIHPTTNEKSLGKAFSNGCIGAGEGDIWRIFFYAPVGTRMQVRYDLDIIDEQGNWVRLADIYGTAPKKEPVAEKTEPSPNTIPPQKATVSFKSDATTPKKEVVTAKKDTIISKKEVVTPKTNVMLPKKEVVSPKTDTLFPKKESRTMPKKEPVMPEPPKQ